MVGLLPTAQPRGLQYKPLSSGRSAAAGGLQGLGAMLMALASGQPQNAGAAFQGGLQGFQEGQYRQQQQAQDQEDREYRRTRQQQEDVERAEKKAQQAAAEAKWGELQTRLSDDDLANDPTGLKDILPFLPPEMQMQMAPDIFAAAEAPKSRERVEGNQTIFEEFDPKTGSWKKVSSGDRWKPEGSGGAGIQIDTDGDGIPDVTIGGGGMKPPNATSASANVRGLLIEQGLEDITKVDFNKVSATKIAAADMANSKGALGELAGNMLLNDDEKRLLGAQGAIQEAVISAITGAAYSEDQKRNMRSKYVVQPTDSPTRRAEKAKAAAQFLQQLDLNSGYTRVPTDQKPDDDGYVIEELP